jgi:hypothetical protein
MSKQIDLSEGNYLVLLSSMTGVETGTNIEKSLMLDPYTYAWLIQP